MTCWRLARLGDRAILRIAGPDGAKLLQGICTQDMNLLSAQRAAAAAFLSPKGRVLCDSILVSHEDNIFVDCHSTVAKSLLRLLLRHKLRMPLSIEDVSGSYSILAALPTEASLAEEGEATTALPSECAEAFFADPRFETLGKRAVVKSDVADAAMQGGSATDASLYHLWRLRCAVPEGPVDLPVDSALPLNGNLDLLNFISFQKGCYVGQELTARSKHVGTVRRRMYSVVAGDSTVFDSLSSTEPGAPLAAATISTAPGNALPSAPARDSGAAKKSEEDSIPVEARLQPDGPAKVLGQMAGTMYNIGLCTVRSDQALHEAADFRRPLVA
eukprot:CAMPEP_0178443672 /NCGR_PEP_ID=MMETSP0689_2-20121128/39037_1 /TAXON_ID=160604 /ORGANISM="Amphidinium massartii, Strain CS-259" /LENGTH=329 /DNA_ID=CAMNT_0020067729 /DNA_START=83 /DNA_END=1069 /DNA_ORIENTATION=+